MSLRARSAASSASATSVALEPINNPPGSPSSQPRPPPSFSQQFLSGTANLANLLPTGTLLAFQLLIPVFTNNGTCDSATRSLTVFLLFLLAASCFLASFTDSVRDSDGKVYYGLATFGGMWLFDSQGAADSGSRIPDLRKYRLGFIDFVHAALSVFVFAAVALREKNVLNCFYPSPAFETQEVLDIVPIGMGCISSFLFMMFPTRRHGIGYPVTPAS